MDQNLRDKAKQNIKDYWEGKTGNDDAISKGLSNMWDKTKALVSGESTQDPTTIALDRRKKMLEGGG